MRRLISGAVLALVGILLATVSPASAFNSFIVPAGEGCGFDLQVEAEHLTDRNPRVLAPIGWGDITITNLETGATYLQRSRYSAIETSESSTGSVNVEVRGDVWINLYPGEPGPSGVVQEPGAALLVSGLLEYTLSEQGVLTAFSLNGTYDDLCALLTD